MKNIKINGCCDQLKGYEERKLVNVECYEEPEEVLLLRQDLTGASTTNLFNSQAEALSFNAGSLDPLSEGKYSIIDQLENYRWAD